LHSWVKRMRCSSPLSERSAIAARRGAARWVKKTAGAYCFLTHETTRSPRGRLEEAGAGAGAGGGGAAVVDVGAK